MGNTKEKKMKDLTTTSKDHPLSPQELQKIFRAEFGYLAYPGRQQFIDARFFLEGTKIGYARLQINELSDRVEWARFYPLYSVDNLDEYERRGIGTLAHTTTICKVARWAPSHFEVYHDPLYTSKKRKNHLQSMGLELEMPLPLYVERSRQKARMQGFSF